MTDFVRGANYFSVGVRPPGWLRPCVCRASSLSHWLFSGQGNK